MESDGKGKSKGKNKGPPLPPSSQSDAGGKGKGYTGTSAMPTTQTKARLESWDVLRGCLGIQSTDGHLEVSALASLLQRKWTGEPIDFNSRLQEAGPLVPTAFMLALWNRMCDLGSNLTSTIDGQTLGTGRGDSEKVSIKVERSSEEQRRLDSKTAMVNCIEATCGIMFDSKAEEWLKTQADEEGIVTLKAKAKDLADEWVPAWKKAPKGKQLSNEDIKRKAEEQRLRQEAQRQEAAKRSEHWRSMSSRPIDLVPWGQVETTMWCSGGTGGAVLVQIGQSEAVVIKPQGMTAVAEGIAGVVAALVGVRVAACRVLTRTQGEYAQMVTAIEEKPTMVPGDEARNLVLFSESQHCLGVVEFVPGVVLQGLEGHNVLTGQAAVSTFRAMGSIIALDCLLNNVDRVPAIWDNDGNLSNIMVSGGDTVIGIDQQVNAIAGGPGRERYFQRVRDFVDDVQEESKGKDVMTRIKTAILENCGVEMTQEHCQAVRDGAREVFGYVAAHQAELAKALKIDGPVAAKMIQSFADLPVDKGITRLDLMLEFVAAGASVVAEHFGTPK
jgi:hypothetical protein